MTTHPSTGRWARGRDERAYLVNKVPEVTHYFWLIVVLCPTVGTTFTDHLDQTPGFGLTDTTLAMSLVFLAFLALQVRAGRYVPSLYWTTVALAGMAGPLVTADLVDRFDVPVTVTALALAALLAATFLAWFLVERTLSLHTIRTPRREAFYWPAVLVSFALGAALGDLLSSRLALGYLDTVLVLAAVVAVVAVGHRGLRSSGVVAFWFALVLTRPFGSSIGDYLSQSRQDGALGVGTTAISVIFLGAVLALVTYLAVTRVDVTDDEQYDAESVAAAAEAEAHQLHP